MKIVTAAEMREIDRVTTEKYGIPSLTLMENAGSAVAEFAERHFDFDSVCVVCGKGNNGGDGFVAARKLSEAGKKVSVIILAKSADELRGDAAEMFKKISMKPLWVADEKDFQKEGIQAALKAELIVDAILGTGFKPPVKGIAAKAIAVINEAPGWVLAVDIPSGMSADAGDANAAAADFIVADGVITFTAPKAIHVFGKPTEGPVAVVEIGSPRELVKEQARGKEDVLSIGELAWNFPKRSPDAHKGEFGHVVVIGGSVGKAGAAAMAGMAALAAGAGLVTVASAKSVQPTIAGFAPELMTVPLPETSEGSLAMEGLPQLENLIAKKDCLAIGPGLSRNPETAELVRKLITSTTVPVVLDADGLNAFSGHVTELSGEVGEGDNKAERTLVLTPHPGEMSRLLGDVGTAQVEGDRLKVARSFAHNHNLVLVLKGHRTLIASPDGSAIVNVTGNPGMAKGGSGDVLTGIVAALIARYSGQHMFSVSLGDDKSAETLEIASMFQKFQETRDQELGMALWKKAKPMVDSAKLRLHGFSAAVAVGLHGLAGDLARDLHGEYSMSATQIIQSVGNAIALIQREAHSRFAYLQR